MQLRQECLQHINMNIISIAAATAGKIAMWILFSEPRAYQIRMHYAITFCGLASFCQKPSQASHTCTSLFFQVTLINIVFVYFSLLVLKILIWLYTSSREISFCRWHTKFTFDIFIWRFHLTLKKPINRLVFFNLKEHRLLTPCQDLSAYLRRFSCLFYVFVVYRPYAWYCV